MVLKTVNCRFSGLRIYPGRGVQFIRSDGATYLFLNRKAKSLFHQRKRPAKLAWTAQFRKAHKKDQESQVARKKRRGNTRLQNRGIAGASLEVIQKKRAEKPEQRQASREAALREVKERMKKSKAAKAAEKAAESKKAGSKAAKNAPRAGGRGGKR